MQNAECRMFCAALSAFCILHSAFRAAATSPMSTLTKFSAIPYTGPAPTNRQPYVPVNADAADARGAALAAKFGVEQETRQDLPTLIVPKEKLLDTLRALKAERFTMPLDCWGVDYPQREQRFDVVYQFYSID